MRRDFEFLKGDKIDFDALFHNRDDQSEHIAFYKERKEFYGHYGFTDIIYAATLLLEQQPVKIPAFDQVLVDEFQDFNQLEVSLIDLLASKSPILIAGDDDQSLYFFKSADHTHIRNRYSRCTRVIVEATNDIVAAAKAEGHLIGRIEKPYIYFEDRKKDADCHLYPKLTHVRCFTTQIPFFVEQTLRQTAEQLKDKFSTLIVAPTKSRCRQIARGLQKRGFRNIQYADQEGLNEPTFFDALTLLAENPRCNLGWRVAAKFFSSPEEMKELVEKTVEAKSDSIRDLLRGDLQRQVKQSLSAFKKVAKNEAIDDDQSDSLSYDLSIDPQVLAQDSIRATIGNAHARESDPATRNIPIRITTIPSSKGLAEDYVFIVDFDDRFFLEKGGECSDQKVFDLLVALTRARRKIFLMSSEAKEPKLLTWIANERIERVDLSGT